MLKYILHFTTITLFCGILLIMQPPIVKAQDTTGITANEAITEPPDTALSDNGIEQEIIQAVPLQAVAGKDRIGVVGRNIVFDSSGSTGPADKTLSYTWDFGDGQQFTGIDASHIYEEPGVYKVKLVVSDGEHESENTILVTIARDVVLLITDHSTPKEQIKQLRLYAERHGVLLTIIRPKNEHDPTYAQSRNLAEQLITSEKDLSQANIIITWTEKNVGLDALSEVGRIFASAQEDVATSKISFNQKVIIRVDKKTPNNVLARLAQNTYNILSPQYILLTTTQALEPILQNPASDDIIINLKNQRIDYQIIGQHSQRVLGTITPLNAISYGINYLINQGVSPDTMFLLLILPVVATLVAFARQIVGIKAFGIYVPSIITLTFVVTQLKYGLLIFTVLLVTATISRILVRNLRILYMPRMAIVLTLVSLSIFATFLLASYFKLTTLLSVSIFPILVMIILTEKFVEAQIEQGNKHAIILTLETLALAVISYLIVTADKFETFIMAYPEIVLLTVLVNLSLGRFTGLRIVEYFRFRKLFKKSST